MRDDTMPADRCPHGTVETETTKCRDCIRARVQESDRPR